MSFVRGKPDLVLSGINGGLNAGINVGHSGTAGAALAAATFGIPAFAVSLESSESMDFGKAAKLVWPLINQIIGISLPPRTVVNINIPAVALDLFPETAPDVVLVPVETNPMAYGFATGADPKGAAILLVNEFSSAGTFRFSYGHTGT